MRDPLLLVVTGRPGSGKTTLARRLAGEIRCPLISRDEIKEGFVRTTGDRGEPGDEVARAVYDAFFATVELFLQRRVSLVAEAAFQHGLWERGLEPLDADLRIVVCDVAPELARSRHAARLRDDPERVRFHHDDAPLPDGYAPPHLDVPILTVNTTDGYDPAFEEIVSFASTP